MWKLDWELYMQVLTETYGDAGFMSVETDELFMICGGSVNSMSSGYTIPPPAARVDGNGYVAAAAIGAASNVAKDFVSGRITTPQQALVSAGAGAVGGVVAYSGWQVYNSAK